MASLLDDLRGAFRSSGNALNQLLLINVVVFVALILLEAITFLTGTRAWYGLLVSWLSLPSDLPTLLTRPWTLLTYAFLHQHFWHILFNLLNLFYFGQLIREYLGNRRLVNLYVLGALAGAVFFIAAYNLIPVYQPMLGVPLLGASAAVTAIIVAAATLLPDFTFQLILLGPVKIKYIAAVLVLLSISGVSGDNAGGQVAHLGGAVLGFIYVRQLRAGRDLGRPVQSIGNWFRALAQPKPTMRTSYRRPSSPTTAGPARPAKATSPADATQEEVDRILDKISRSGYESLTTEEKQQLFRASQK